MRVLPASRTVDTKSTDDSARPEVIATAGAASVGNDVP